MYNYIVVAATKQFDLDSQDKVIGRTYPSPHVRNERRRPNFETGVDDGNSGYIDREDV